MTQANDPALQALIRTVGKSAVDVSEKGRYAASYDSARISVMPQAVIRPKDEAQVGKILRLANMHKIPVTVRGGGSAMTGATVPVKGGWVLDLSRWKKLKISAAESLAYAQPGVILEDLDAAAHKVGLFYPPDPSSKKYATVGGSISTNAGGLHGAKYGVTRDYVVALEGFLPTGDFVRWGRPLRKYASGYNLRDLWVGAEGTLGVITRAVFKLIPRPSTRATFLCAFKDDAAALAAVGPLREAGVEPSVLEYMDVLSVRCAADFMGEPVFAAHPAAALLLAEVDGAASDVKTQSTRLEAWAKKHALAFRRSKNETQAEALWEVRRKCSPAMFHLGDTKLSEDVVIPLGSYGKFTKLIAHLTKSTGLPVPVFGHVGDGNFHIHFMYAHASKQERACAEAGVRELFKGVVSLGGAISGEHGIGLSKSPFFSWQHTPAEEMAQRAVKKALDPNDILNPGKLFYPVQVSEFEPVRVKMPWDHKP